MQRQFILTPFFLDEPLPGLGSLAKPHWKVNEPQLKGDDKQSRMSVLHGKIARFTEKIVSQGDLPVSIAGDCCTTIGVLAGLQRAGVFPTLLWFDAHGDFNTWETSPGGFLGGMPLAMLVGRGEQTLLRNIGLRPIAEEQVILTDARDLDPGECEAVGQSHIQHLPDINRLFEIDFSGRTLYIHFDTDIVDPTAAPAMNYPVKGGPSPDALSDIFHFLKNTAQICALSMSSWNPVLDCDHKSGAVCMELFSILLPD